MTTTVEALKIEIDPSGMRAQAQEAKSAIESIGQSSTSTASILDRFGRDATRGFIGLRRDVRDIAESLRGLQVQTEQTTGTSGGAGKGVAGMNRALATTGEALQIGGRVRLLTSEINALGQGMGSASGVALLLGQGLLDVAQITEKVRQTKLEQVGGEAATGFGKLFSVLRANPLLATVTALGAVAAALSLFGTSASKAADQQQKLNESIERTKSLRLDQVFDLKIGLGFDVVKDLEGKINSLRETSQAIRKLKEEVSFEQLQNVLELNNSQANDLFAGRVQKRNVFDLTAGAFTGFQRTDRFLAPEDAAQVVEQQAERARKALEQIRPPTQITAPAPDTTQLNDYIASLRTETDLLRLSESEREKAIAVLQAENIARQTGASIGDAERSQITEQIALQRQLTDLRQLGQDLGAALGDGFLNAARGAQTFRQALVGILQQLAAIGQQSIVRSFSNAVGQLFASTGSQIRDPGVGGVGGLNVGESGPTVPPGYTP